MTILLFSAACFLAYSNGSNDNFKGVATLFGSYTTTYKTAIGWATATTFFGAVCSIFFAKALAQTFSGVGLVSQDVVTSLEFLTAVAIGAALTVILATVTGFPISTTHSLMGGLVGGRLVAVGRQVNLAALGSSFVLPLVFSPLIAILLAGALYALFRCIRIGLSITKEWYVCIGQREEVIPIPQPTSALASAVSQQLMSRWTQRRTAGRGTAEKSLG